MVDSYIRNSRNENQHWLPSSLDVALLPPDKYIFMRRSNHQRNELSRGLQVEGGSSLKHEAGSALKHGGGPVAGRGGMRVWNPNIVDESSSSSDHFGHFLGDA